MAFNADYFIFDEVPCETYGLTLYSFKDSDTEESSLFSGAEVIEDRIAGRYTPIHYGVTNNEPLIFELTFGSKTQLDRYDIDVIARWLTGHTQYKMLDIVQADLSHIRYKCIVTKMDIISISDFPVAFRCEIRCDSQFGYTYPIDYNVKSTGSASITINNNSSFNGYYKPKMTITVGDTEDNIKIINVTDGSITEFRELSAFKGLKIMIDNERQIITAEPAGVNMYPHFNYQFFQMLPGMNQIQIVGACDVRFTCEFPKRVGV